MASLKETDLPGTWSFKDTHHEAGDTLTSIVIGMGMALGVLMMFP
jgi:hypothetical protein